MCIRVESSVHRAAIREGGREKRAKNGKNRRGRRREGDLEVLVLDLEAGEEDERDDRRHDAPAARRRRRLVLHVAKAGAGAAAETGRASRMARAGLEGSGGKVLVLSF